MTDADRLRQAAREMNDPLADEVSRHTAALLWAVADKQSNITGTWDADMDAAAAALADTIVVEVAARKRWTHPDRAPGAWIEIEELEGES